MGLNGETSQQQIQVDMIYELSQDILRARMAGDTSSARKSLIAAASLLGDKDFYVASRLTLADLAIFCQLFVLYQNDQDALLKFPKLAKFVERVMQLPNIANYLKSDRLLPLTKGELQELPFPEKYEFVMPLEAIQRASLYIPVRSTSLRVLCFHGGGSNIEVYRYQCRAILDELDDGAICEFVQGCHKCSSFIDPLANAISPGTDKFSWYDVSCTGSEGEEVGNSHVVQLTDRSTHVQYLGVEAALQRLEPHCRPGDIHLAFSQGTVISTLLTERLPPEKRPQLLVLVCPIPPRDGESALRLFPHAPKINIPCILLYGGPTDYAHEYGQCVQNNFMDPSVYVHGEGHTMPQKKQNVKHVASLIDAAANVKVH